MSGTPPARDSAYMLSPSLMRHVALRTNAPPPLTDKRAWAGSSLALLPNGEEGLQLSAPVKTRVGQSIEELGQPVGLHDGVDG